MRIDREAFFELRRPTSCTRGHP